VQRIPFAAFGFIFVACATGCSGGGGSSTPSPGLVVVTPSPVPPVAPTPPPPVNKGSLTACTPFSTPVPGPRGASNPSAYAIQSVPNGLAVTATGGTSANGVTPTTITAASSSTATTFTITPSNGVTPYSFVCDQRANGTRTLLYNQNADTAGSIGSIATSSASRAFDTSSASNDAAGLPRLASRGALGRPAFSSTRIVVRYRAATLARTGQRAFDLERQAGIERGIDVGPSNAAVLTRVVDVPAGSSISTVAARLGSEPGVESATPERLYYKQSATAITPSDKRFDSYQQWGEFQIKAPNAWGYTTGSSSIAIAIIDTGADFNHADLTGKITFAESVLSGTTTVGNAAAQDTDGHGSNVAGIAAANTDNAFGIAGTGFNSSLQIYKVFADGTAANKYSTTANSGDVTKAIYDAEIHGAKVINLSLGTCQGSGADPMQRDAISYVISRGVTVVAAAGNERAGSTDAACTNSGTLDYPAAYDGVISVGATKLDDTAAPKVYASAIEKVAGYSNVGPGLTVVAPGGDPTSADTAPGAPANLLHWILGLYTTTPANPTQTCKDITVCLALFAGTSQATPHVAGTVALMLALNSGLSPAQIKTILMANADDIGDPSQGGGRLNAYRALAAVKGDPIPPGPPTNANFVAFAYLPNSSNVPNILDVTYQNGVPVASNGTFRVADIPASASGYKIGVWYDANGDGKIDAGDYFGSSATTCSASAPCASAASIVVHPVSAGFVP